VLLANSDRCLAAERIMGTSLVVLDRPPVGGLRSETRAGRVIVAVVDAAHDLIERGYDMEAVKVA
jgi:hypothetical protein